MTRLHLAALHAFRHGHGYHPHYGYRGSGWSDWIANSIVSAVIHAVIYGAVFRLMRQLTTTQALVLAGVVILCVLLWGRTRDRRGW